MNGKRRRLLAALAAASFAKASEANAPSAKAPSSAKATEGMPEAKEAARLSFPRDCGAHLAYRTEWWYLTGQLDPPAGSREPRLGVQLTFFRIHPPLDPGNPSRFAAHQLVLAHAAIADPRRGALLHEERIARAGFGIASVSDADTEVEVDHWRLAREAATGVYRGQAHGAQFALELTAVPTQPPLAQGEDGYSRKGPTVDGATPASLYYSEPQLALQARVRIDDGGTGVSGNGERRLGRGWLDHEWTSSLLPPQASGWDWAGFNLDDGSALTVFRIRRTGANSGDPSWFAYASLRPPGARVQIFSTAQVRFEPLQTWTSPRTRAAYPVAQRIAIGSRRFETRPLMPDQELDARAGGVVYWEGASDLLEDGRTVGRGYLELTGYAGPVPGTLSG